MVSTRPINADAVARQLADRVRACEDALAIWTRVHRDVVELWLVTKPIDLHKEKHFYEVSQKLYEDSPVTHICFHLVNPEMFDPFVLEQIIPAEAESLPLR